MCCPALGSGSDRRISVRGARGRSGPEGHRARGGPGWGTRGKGSGVAASAPLPFRYARPGRRYSLAGSASIRSHSRGDKNCECVGDLGRRVPRQRGALRSGRPLVVRSGSGRGVAGGAPRGARAGTASAGRARGRGRAGRSCDVPRRGVGASGEWSAGSTSRRYRGVGRCGDAQIAVGPGGGAARAARLGGRGAGFGGAACERSGRTAAYLESVRALSSAHRARSGLAQGDTALRGGRGRLHRRVRGGRPGARSPAPRRG